MRKPNLDLVSLPRITHETDAGDLRFALVPPDNVSRLALHLLQQTVHPVEIEILGMGQSAGTGFGDDVRKLHTRRAQRPGGSWYKNRLAPEFRGDGNNVQSARAAAGNQ